MKVNLCVCVCHLILLMLASMNVCISSVWTNNVVLDFWMRSGMQIQNPHFILQHLEPSGFALRSYFSSLTILSAAIVQPSINVNKTVYFV